MGETYIYPSKFAYDNISEERTTEYNLGVDWALFNNRITGQFDYYNRRTRDLLLRAWLSSTLGYSSQYVNFGTVENSGVEFRSEEHTSELQSLMRISYAYFCLKKKN